MFGNVHLKVDKAMASLDSIQNQISSNGYFDDLLERELQAQLDPQQALSLQESLWKEKARLN